MKYRLVQVGVLLVAAAFFGYWALLVYCEMWRASPLGLPLRFDAGRVIVVDTVPGGPAQRAGVRAGDRIASVDGHPVGSRMDWVTVEANYEIGRATHLSVDRDGAVFTASITPQLASWQSWRSQHGPTLLVVRLIQLVTLLLALMVAIKRSRDATAIVGSVFLATIGVFSLTLPFRFASVWRTLPPSASLVLWIPFMSSVTIAAWGFSFFVIFPRVRVRTRLAWCAAWIPLVPGLVGHGIFGYHTIVLGQPAPPLPPWFESLVVVGVAYMVIGLAVLVLNYHRLTDVNERRRVRVVLAGSLIGGIAGTPVVLTYWRTATNNLDQSFLASRFATLGTFLFLALPLSFAYAILRHRLFDISVIIRQGLRYALARRALLGLVPVLLVFLSLDLLAHGDESVGAVLRSRLWVYVSLVGLAVVARMRRHVWLDALDRRFFRERYNGQRLLREVAEDVRQAPSLEPMAPTVVSRIEQALHPRFVALLVRDDERRQYRTVAASPIDAAPGSLNADNKVLALARLLGKPLDIGRSETDWLARKMPVGDVRSIQAAAIDLVVPVRSGDGDAIAMFVLGPKRSEEPYSEDDGELLMAIAENVAMRLPAVEAAVTGGTERFEECPACGGCYDAGTGRCRAEGAALVAVTAPRLLAGRYQLERRLGRGGMGTVYVALDTALDRRVAAKLLAEDLLGLPEAAERFQREARVAAAFSHPNVVTVHDFGVAGGHAFLVMELLDGRTLRDVLRAEERVGPQRALAILRDVTAAVEAAHRRQLVHRDLKPENICLVSYGSGETAKVLDFGIAKVFGPKDGDLLMTHSTGGALLGTPWYMAPEQLRGEDPDPSWDLWALTIIAFEMLTGSHPFASMTLDRDLLTRESATDPRLAHLPHRCRQFFAGALALDRAARPESPAAFLTELERSLNA
jgi:eukaryotic-like serine/threonine-protein kinase